MLVRMKAMRTGLLFAGSLVVVALSARGALALELGELTVSSAINEPLAASIELLDVAGLEPGQIEIAFGDPAEFEQAGLEQALLLSGVRFEVQTSGSTGTVRLSTADNIVEPFLNFILSARWPNGRQVRTYTLLLDLPTFSQAPAPQPAPAAAAPGAATTAAGTAAAASSYEVGAGDTLWEIARTTRPDASVSMQQMMVAIQRANPDAFVDNNINRIRSGRVLRIPPLQDIAALEQEAAVAQVNQQNGALAAQPLAAGGAAATGTAQQQDELTLLNGDSPAAPTGPDTSELAATIAELESALMMSEENLDRARLEYEELSGRLASLEAEIVLLRNIIAVEDQLLAQLQQELAAQNSAAAAQPQPAAAPSGLAGLLQNTAVLLGVLLALVLAVVGLLVLKRRRAEHEEAQRHDYDQFKDLSAAGVLPEQVASRSDLPPGFRSDVRSRERLDDEASYYADTETDSDTETGTSAPSEDAAGSEADQGGVLTTAASHASEVDEVQRTDAEESMSFSAVAATAAQDADPVSAEAIDIDFSEVPEPEAYAYTLPDEPEQGLSAADLAKDLESFEFRPAPVQLGSDEDLSLEAVPVAEGLVTEPENLFEDTMQFAEDEEFIESVALSGQEEYDTKLDLATAFEAMGERDDALQILDEVIADGNPQQVETAQRLKQRWQSGS